MIGSGRGWTPRLSLVFAAALLLMTSICGPTAGAATTSPPPPTNDPFYAYTGSLTGVAPGTVLRTRSATLAYLTAVKIPVQTTQVLYRTTDELGRPSVDVATIIRPLGDGPTRLVDYSIAYDGLGADCDASYALDGGPFSPYNTIDETFLLDYLAAGDTVVSPDYEGEQEDWASGQESGYGTLDGIRAAEHTLGVPAASTPVGLVGYSGGSIPTDFAAELAPTYAPELHIIGAAAGGVPVDLDHNLPYVNGTPEWSGVIPAVLVSLARGFGFSLTPYLSAYGAQLAHTVSDQCIIDFLSKYPGLTYQKLLLPAYSDPTATMPGLVKAFNDTTMGTDGTPAEPMMLADGNADGTGDGVMVAADLESLAHEYCQRGVAVEFSEYKGLNHIAGIPTFEAAALNYLGARFAGQPAPDDCSTIAAGNPLTPLPPPVVPSNLSVRYVTHAGRVTAARLATVAGTFTGLTFRISRGRSVLFSMTLPAVGEQPRTVRLRSPRARLAAGRYVLTVSDGTTALNTRSLTVRRPRKPRG